MLKIYMTYRWLHLCLGFILVYSNASEKVSCPDPGVSEDGSREGSCCDVGDVLWYYCNENYELVGYDDLQCLPNGTWSSERPLCQQEESCSDPGVSKNSSREGSCCGVGAVLRYSCNEDYYLVGHEEIECLPTGNWSSGKPLCQEKVSCADPGVSKDGNREGSCCSVGSFLWYSCNEDYELVGLEGIECLPTGNWSSGRPLCRPFGDHCTIPPAITHGVINGSKEGDYYRPNDTVQLVCELGYSHPEECLLVECQKDGEWEIEFGECTEIFCDPPEPLKNGNITELQFTNLTSFPFNFELTYVCDKGFWLIGGDSWRFCDSTGWSGKNPYCEVIRCPDPGVPDHGSRTGNSFYIGSKIIFKCSTGYKLIGSFERYCRPNGQWTGELARCDTESNYCPDPGIPINGYKNSTDYSMGSLVGFRCRPSYIRIGSEARVCQPNRTWSGEETICMGKYDYGNSAEIRDSLKIAMSSKAAEQERKLKEYRDLFATTRTIPMNYPGRLIFYFVFDVSSSIGKDNFDKSIEFAKAIVKKVGITVAGARAGAITFSSLSHIEFWPFDYNTTEGVLNALDRVNYTGGGTSASSAFTHLRQEIIPTTEGVLKKNRQKSIVFFLTDGRANMGGDPQEEAKVLKKKAGVEIYCIGVTGDLNTESLWNIASKPEKEHVFILKNYQTLAWLVQELTNGTVDYSRCGLGMEAAGNRLPRPRIVGGIEAPEPWPWMVPIYFSKPGTFDPKEAELNCGGSIIDKYFILTAAHCLFYYDQKSLKWVRRGEKEIIVKLGLTDVKNETFIQEPEVKFFYTHPNHLPSAIYHDYDIALLQLNTPIEFNAYVRPICLPPKDLPANSTFYKANEFAVATGFGHTKIFTHGIMFDFRGSDHLKEVILQIQTKDSCTQSLVNKGNHYKDYFTDRMFCAGNARGGTDTCPGDSGGPLMQSQINEEGYRYWTQIGIVSWGLGCGDVNSYGFYSHVQKLRAWIDETIKNSERKISDEH